MKHILYLTFFLINLLTNAQETVPVASSLRIGSGAGFLGSGDVIALTLHGEYDFYHNPKRSSSISIGLGNSDTGVNENTHYYQINLNTFLSPFNRKGLDDFRVGTGLSYYRVNETILFSQFITNGVVEDNDYIFEARNSLGLNFIIERTWQLSEKSLLALSTYTQPYFNGDTITGISLKFGIAR